MTRKKCNCQFYVSERKYIIEEILTIKDHSIRKDLYHFIQIYIFFVKKKINWNHKMFQVKNYYSIFIGWF